MRYIELSLSEADAPGGMADKLYDVGRDVVIVGSGVDSIQHAIQTAKKDVAGKLFTIQGGKKTLTQLGKNLFTRFVPRVLFGIGALMSLYSAYENYKEGDWKGALALIGAAGLNLAEITGLVTGGATTVASIIAQVAAYMYAERESLFPLFNDGRAMDPNSEEDKARADAMLGEAASQLVYWLWDELKAFVSYLGSWLPGASSAKDSATTTPAAKKQPWLPSTQPTPAKKQPWLPTKQPAS